MKSVELIETNRQMWEETALIHERVAFESLLAQAHASDFSTLDVVARERLAELGLAGKAAAQLSCNNARELLSIKKAGAGRCVGFDISERFIDQGRRLAQAGNVELELCRTNVYEIPASYDANFDLVILTVGVLGWLPDAAGFFQVAARLLKPGGDLFVYEMHPLLDMFDDQKLDPLHPTLARSYFLSEPILGQDLPDYFDQNAIVHSRSYWVHHKLSDIIGGVVRAGLQLTSFQEYAHDVSGVYQKLERCPHPLPLSYTLTARKSKN
jgi:SAM-dependent methyltransferase